MSVDIDLRLNLEGCMYRGVVLTFAAFFSISCFAGEMIGREEMLREVNECLEDYEYEEFEAVVRCLKREYAIWDSVLNKNYSGLQESIRYMINNDINEHPKEIPELLTRSQRRWIEFRDSECGFVRLTQRGEAGLREEISSYVCLIENTYDRAYRFYGYRECVAFYRFSFMCLVGVG